MNNVWTISKTGAATIDCSFWNLWSAGARRKHLEAFHCANAWVFALVLPSLFFGLLCLLRQLIPEPLCHNGRCLGKPKHPEYMSTKWPHWHGRPHFHKDCPHTSDLFDYRPVIVCAGNQWSREQEGLVLWQARQSLQLLIKGREELGGKRAVGGIEEDVCE